jgi:ATP-dependent RNA helicase DeaD
VAAGFAATALSGELDQAARNRALSAFKQGREAVLVATDVAARGLDVQDVTRVIHFEPPTSADAYTHRSGRTGRAGRKGKSCLLVSLSQVVPATRLLRSAGIPHRFEPIPTAESIRRAADERAFAELTSDETNPADTDARARSLARRLLATADAERTLARLLLRARGAGAGAAEPRDIREVALPVREQPRQRDRTRPQQEGRSGGERPGPHGDFVPFRVTWGGRHGADARRVLALVCRRGQIRGSDVGAIRIEADHSIVEVARAVAQTFATHAGRPDARDRRVRISPLTGTAGGTPPRRRRAPR